MGLDQIHKLKELGESIPYSTFPVLAAPGTLL